MQVLLPDNWCVKKFEMLDSTMDEARRLIKADEEIQEGLIILACEQLKGRGRRNRPWDSLRGNLHCSILVEIKENSSRTSELSFVSALSVGKTLACYLTDPSLLSYKWPNDVLVNKKKISGILLETEKSLKTEKEWLIDGIGVNLVAAPQNVTYPATSLKEEDQREVLVEEFLERLAFNFHEKLLFWRQHGFEEIRKEWLLCAEGLGQVIRVRYQQKDKENCFIEGRFLDLDAQGRLLLEDNDGKQMALTMGDVFFSE
jgi:BirA family biotin operon repressor/biotin-[acetyl-CoA-carboxylase] ligase